MNDFAQSIYPDDQNKVFKNESIKELLQYWSEYVNDRKPGKFDFIRDYPVSQHTLINPYQPSVLLWDIGK